MHGFSQREFRYFIFKRFKVLKFEYMVKEMSREDFKFNKKLSDFSFGLHFK